jgi:hypothetical protein
MHRQICWDFNRQVNWHINQFSMISHANASARHGVSGLKANHLVANFDYVASR